MLVQEVPETVSVPVLRTEVAGRVSINILRVNVGACHQQRLNDAELAPQTRNVQGRPEIPRPGVDSRFILHKELYQVDVALIGRHV